MTVKTRGRFRHFLRDLHLWLGVGLCLLAAPIGISGSLLVWHDGVEVLLAPERHATTGTERGPTLADFAGRAIDRLGDGARVTQIRLPESAGDPVVVVARPADAGPRDTVSVWFDPPTGEVLDVGPSNNAFMRLMHDLHGNLLVPQFSGRQIVGWVGVAMLVLALSGIYLWWPRRLSLVRALGWRRNMMPSSNMHHMFGIWIAIPLAILSLTGMYLSFPQTSRAALGALVETTPQAPRGPGGPGGRRFGGDPMTATAMTPDQALATAMAAAPAGALPTSLSLPTVQGPEWRLMLAADTGNVTVTVADATGATKVSEPPPPRSGDIVGRWMRWLHDGNNTGLVWQAVIFVGGLLPTLFAITGVMMWLRRRKAAKMLAAKRAAALNAG